MVAYYVHAEVGLAAAGLFMAQAVVLFIYTQHLAQPRKGLTVDDLTGNKRSQSTMLTKNKSTAADRVYVPAAAEFTCKVCGEGFDTLTDVSKHHRKDHPKAI